MSPGPGVGKIPPYRRGFHRLPSDCAIPCRAPELGLDRQSFLQPVSSTHLFHLNKLSWPPSAALLSKQLLSGTFTSSTGIMAPGGSCRTLSPGCQVPPTCPAHLAQDTRGTCFIAHLFFSDIPQGAQSRLDA